MGNQGGKLQNLQDSRKKKILIVCNYFAPENVIASVRITKLAKYLRYNGYDVEVLAEKKNLALEDELLKEDVEGIKVHYAKNSSFYRMIYDIYRKITNPYRKKRFARLKDRKKINPQTGKMEFYTFETAYPIIGSCDYLMNEWKQRNLCSSVISILRQADDFDCIITSHEYSFAYFAGRYFHECHRQIPWIFDLRDSIYRYKFVPDYVAWLPKRYERYIWNQASRIIGVSKAICKRVPEEYQKKVQCITNGFDVSDRTSLKNERIGGSNMVFTYTGSMYGGLQDLSAFFECIRRLIDQKKVDEERLEFHFAGNGPAYEIFKGQANVYGLAHRCVTHGKLSRRDSMELQQCSDILLMASYDYKDHEGGVITGKMLEYMAANRPVISIITGDIENSELAGIVRKTNVGIAYEESFHTRDFEVLCRYVHQQYLSFTQNQKILHAPNKDEVAKYDYRNLVEEYIRVIEGIEQGIGNER